jgi:uncharacterized BrkB/YihY/UPF0761 family membrane protein
MSDEEIANIADASVRRALDAIDIPSATFQVWTPAIVLLFLFTIVMLFTTIVFVTVEDQNVEPSTLLGLVLTDIVLLILSFIFFFILLRNIGKYVYGRISPVRVKEFDALFLND